ncbi:sterol desaturase family protein [Nannocystis pusilla]|uniref:sterol desaturase family protein n=1 Tax=Nannocystis pusilla TaxID=889268 RepID=UPI003B777C3B
MQLIAWSIPVFVALIVLEYALARRARRDLYRLSVSVSDVGCGVVQQLFGVLTTAAFVGLYFFVYEARLFDLDPRAASTWLLAMLAVDFIYYWWHRASHEVGVLWATHVVHHHSEDYNLAVALRQGIFTAGPLIVFGLPLALLGVPPVVYLTSKALNSLYQFWIHTELIGDLGPAEAVLNTPQHHRVHHAVNPRYLDKNYGGILIVWDRLFGTFARVDEAPVYGTTRRLQSLNPLWAQFEHIVELARRAAAERGLLKGAGARGASGLDAAWAVGAAVRGRVGGAGRRAISRACLFGHGGLRPAAGGRHRRRVDGRADRRGHLAGLAGGAGLRDGDRRRGRPRRPGRAPPLGGAARGRAAGDDAGGGRPGARARVSPRAGPSSTLARLAMRAPHVHMCDRTCLRGHVLENIGPARRGRPRGPGRASPLGHTARGREGDAGGGRAGARAG